MKTINIYKKDLSSMKPGPYSRKADMYITNNKFYKLCFDNIEQMAIIDFINKYDGKINHPIEKLIIVDQDNDKIKYGYTQLYYENAVTMEDTVDQIPFNTKIRICNAVVSEIIRMHQNNFVYNDLHERQILIINNDILFIDVDSILTRQNVTENNYNMSLRNEILCSATLVLFYLYKIKYEGPIQMSKIIPILSIPKEFKNYLIEAIVNCSLTDYYIDNFMNELDEEKVKYDGNVLYKKGIIKR